MADKAATPTEVETTPEVCEKVEKKKVEEKPAAEDSKAKNGDAENGSTEKTEAENGEEEEEETKDKKNGSDDTDKCCIKRKSTGGDATEATPAEGATPEKKAKLSEPAEETKEAEVSA